MSFSVKRFLPKTLFGRSLLIIITPVLILQVLGTYIFYDRHWSRMTDRLAFALVGEIAIITGEIEVGRSAEDIDRISDIIARDLKLNINYDPDIDELPAERIDGWRQQMVAKTLKDGLKGRLNMPFSMFFGEDGRWLDVSFLLENGVLTVSVPENRLFSSSSYIFILWLIGLSVVLFSIAVIFMRNQIRPIRRLAVAAEWFGRGRDIPDFKPHGAKEVRQASNAFITMRDRIKRQISQRTEMLAGVSHDLRTPLTRMKLELELLDDRDSKAIRADIADMENMIEGYLDFARGDAKEEPELIDVRAIIEKAVKDAIRQKIDIVYKTEVKEPVSIWIRIFAFERCLSNLISNAGQYAQHCQISLEVDHNNMQTVILIDDDGPGIPEDKRDEVFKPFYRLEESRNKKTGGVGLGMSIAQDVVYSHGGQIMLEDSPLGGLRVRILLPI